MKYWQIKSYLFSGKLNGFKDQVLDHKLASVFFSSISVQSKDPKFANLFTFVEVNEEHFKYGVPLRYNHTTYPGDELCPCNVFEYSIIEVEDVMVNDNPNRFNIFDIDRLAHFLFTLIDKPSLYSAWSNVCHFGKFQNY